MMPSAKMNSANAPAIGLSASAACDEDWMSVMPVACSVAAVVMMIAIAIRLENAMPTSVSIRMRRISSLPIGGILLQRLLVGIDALLFGLLRRLPDEQIRRDGRAEDGDQRGQKRCVPL